MLAVSVHGVSGVPVPVWLVLMLALSRRALSVVVAVVIHRLRRPSLKRRVRLWSIGGCGAFFPDRVHR
jgi:hypothetical protein